MSPEIRARHSLAEGLAFIALDALSNFEADLIIEIARRRRQFGPEAVVTDIEADVLLGAIEAMEAHLVRTAAEMRSGFEAMLGRVQIELGAGR